VRRTISRRSFVSTGAILFAASAVCPRSLFSAQEERAPAVLDHILLGCSDLDRGIAFVEKHTGIPAAFGGVHPGRGTRNALLSLGEPSRAELNPRRYLEIIAPDPEQPGAPDHYGLLKLTEPRLVGWAAHPGDLNQFATRLRNQDIAFDVPNPGSRKRGDGLLLEWKTLNLKDDLGGLLPFFIEWSAGTSHPSVDAPRGCHLVRFELLTPDPEKLRSAAAAMGLAVEIAKSAKLQLRATTPCRGRKLVLTS
jgi:catechol 2,3-dioxygenase-like lactoylglutathione lyase family enzyme